MLLRVIGLFTESFKISKHLKPIEEEVLQNNSLFILSYEKARPFNSRMINHANKNEKNE